MAYFRAAVISATSAGREIIARGPKRPTREAAQADFPDLTQYIIKQSDLLDVLEYGK